jgi:RNA polymerase sigma-70 factor (ECF subfamily)
VQERLAEEFATERDHLLAVAYRMLGSRAEAEDAVQEAWLRFAGALGDPAARAQVRDVRGWLTTTVARICLDVLRSARVRREAYVGPWLPEPVVSRLPGGLAALPAAAHADPGGFAPDPGERVARVEEVSMALLVVLERLTPEQRVAFVLHDVFAVPFDEIAAVLGGTPAAARQLASRARKAVAEGGPKHTADLPEQRRVLSAFLDAATSGDFQGLLAVLAPDVIAVGDGGGFVPAGARPIVGATQVARFLISGLRRVQTEAATLTAEPVLVNGSLGLLVDSEFLGQPIRVVMAVTVADGRVTGVFDQLNPAKLTGLPETARGGWPPRL